MQNNQFQWLPFKEGEPIASDFLLVACFNKDSWQFGHKMYGQVSFIHGELTCMDGMNYMVNPTHYFDIDRFDLEKYTKLT